MKRTTILYASLALASLLVTPSCRLHEGEAPKTETENTDGIAPLSYDLTLPASTADIEASELQALRDLFDRNGLADDIASDKPTQWNLSRLAVNFVLDASGKAHVSQLLTGTAGTSPITQLDVLSAETYPELREISLLAPKLRKVSLQHLPKLQKLTLAGTAGQESAPLTVLSYEQLPALEEVTIQDFPALKTTSTDNAFKLPVEMKLPSGEGADKLPQLQKLTLANLPAIEDLYIEPLHGALRGGVTLRGLSSADLIKISHAKLTALTLDGKDFPKLRYLTLHSIEEGSASSLQLTGFPLLETFDISRAPSLSEAKLSDCPALQSLTITQTKVASPQLASLPKLRSVDLSDNEIATLDLASFASLTRVGLGHNRIASLQSIKLPTSLESLSLSGNEELTELDLSAYKQLQHFACFGLKKGATSQDHSQRGKLTKLNIKGLKKLETLRVPNNQLVTVFEEGQSYPELESLDLSYNSLTPASVLWAYAILGPAKKDAEDYDRSIKQSKVTLTAEMFAGQVPFTVTLDQQGNYSYADIAAALRAAQFDPSDPSYLAALWKRGATEVELSSASSDFTGNGIDSQRYVWPFDREGNTYRIRVKFTFFALDGIFPAEGMTSLPFTVK